MRRPANEKAWQGKPARHTSKGGTSFSLIFVMSPAISEGVGKLVRYVACAYVSHSDTKTVSCRRKARSKPSRIPPIPAKRSIKRTGPQAVPDVFRRLLLPHTDTKNGGHFRKMRQRKNADFTGSRHFAEHPQRHLSHTISVSSIETSTARPPAHHERIDRTRCVSACREFPD